MTDTPIVTYRIGNASGPLPDAHFDIAGFRTMLAIVCVDHDGIPYVLVDENCGNEDVKLPGGTETGREISRLIPQAARGSKQAQNRLAAFAVEGIMIARGLREGHNDNDPIRAKRLALHDMVNVELAKVGLRMPR